MGLDSGGSTVQINPDPVSRRDGTGQKSRCVTTSLMSAAPAPGREPETGEVGHERTHPPRLREEGTPLFVIAHIASVRLGVIETGDTVG